MSNKTSPGTGEMEPEEERELVRRAKEGDGAALEHLLAAHQDLVYRTALRFTAGREEAAFELAQEVLISAFRHIAKFRGDSRFRTWLYRITANLAKNRYVVENREKKRFRSLDQPWGENEDDKPPEWAAGGVDARTAASDREVAAVLVERLELLEPEWREVVVLRFFEEMSYEEIAQVLDVPVGTVKSRINRARKALRDIMADVLKERQS
ncbi:sigma-70 family RNA polymerase sigma factor [Candidatus Poribacteria bacterium]|nr:sigma-70 family RNA polymerase sigma factor [Candidatus Poribacteria bacterium]